METRAINTGNYYPWDTAEGTIDGTGNSSVVTHEKVLLLPETEWQNVAVLGAVLAMSLAANLVALPVILFR